MSLERLKVVRAFELKAILERIAGGAPKGARVLDVGAGTGWQAMAVADAGYRVEAIDLPASIYARNRAFPIADYDGHHMPFPDNSFDVIYSSNALEHVAHAEAFQHEIQRILKPEGIAIHVVPSATWRFWTNFAHYPYVVRQAFTILSGRGRSRDGSEVNARSIAERGLRAVVSRILVPNRDGEVGNAFTEIYFFSRWRWSDLFRRTGWVIEERCSNRLFYTGRCLLGTRLPVTVRSHLSWLLGGSCHVFVLRPAQTTRPAAPESLAAAGKISGINEAKVTSAACSHD